MPSEETVLYPSIEGLVLVAMISGGLLLACAWPLIDPGVSYATLRYLAGPFVAIVLVWAILRIAIPRPLVRMGPKGISIDLFLGATFVPWRDMDELQIIYNRGNKESLAIKRLDGSLARVPAILCPIQVEELQERIQSSTWWLLRHVTMGGRANDAEIKSS